jgi:site-specific DNA recombinase
MVAPKQVAPDCKAVGIWIRVSTEDQARGESPEHHERRARYYAEAKGWLIKEVYHLEAVSGKSVMDHPEAKRMLRDVERGHITGLIFSKLARLARNTKELLEFADIFRNLNADLVSLQESIDTSSPAGRLFYTMIAAMAQWEREEIGERINASIAIRAKLGKPISGRAPFGYMWKDKQLVPNPSEAPVRRLVYELFAEHRRKKTVARLLNDAGHRMRKGILFTDTTVGRLLRDSTAKGTHRTNYSKKSSDGRAIEMKPESAWGYHPVEPVVSEELWNKCDQILREQKKPLKRPGRKAIHLFAGIVRCHCGNKMYVFVNSPKYICNECNNKIAVVDIEAIFFEELKNYFLSPDELVDQLQKIDQTISEKIELLDVLNCEYEKAKKESQRVYQLYAEGGLSAEGFSRFYQPLEQRLKELDQEIPRVQAMIDVLKIKTLSSDEVIAEAKDLYTRWPKLDRQAKREIVENITNEVVVGKDEISIKLCYLPTSKKVTNEQRILPLPKLSGDVDEGRNSRPIRQAVNVRANHRRARLSDRRRVSGRRIRRRWIGGRWIGRRWISGRRSRGSAACPCDFNVIDLIRHRPRAIADRQAPIGHRYCRRSVEPPISSRCRASHNRLPLSGDLHGIVPAIRIARQDMHLICSIGHRDVPRIISAPLHRGQSVMQIIRTRPAIGFQNPRGVPAKGQAIPPIAISFSVVRHITRDRRQSRRLKINLSRKRARGRLRHRRLHNRRRIDRRRIDDRWRCDRPAIRRGHINVIDHISRRCRGTADCQPPIGHRYAGCSI